MYIILNTTLSLDPFVNNKALFPIKNNAHI
jgi:hypothetical protein